MITKRTLSLFNFPRLIFLQRSGNDWENLIILFSSLSFIFFPWIFMNESCDRDLAAFGWDERGASLRTSWQSLSFRSRLDRSNRVLFVLSNGTRMKYDVKTANFRLIVHRCSTRGVFLLCRLIIAQQRPLLVGGGQFRRCNSWIGL